MANVPLSFKKLASVAGIGNTPDTMYFVQAPDSEIVDIYVSDSTGTKIAEYESMDVVLQWNDIQGKPTSAVADIDDAVANRHSHANKALLDPIS